MIIYNVTTQVDWIIHEDWLQWMKSVHIPDTLDTGMFTHHRLVRLLEVEETDGPTYAVQYFTTTLFNYHQFKESFSGYIRQKEIEKWGDKMISFGTVMQVVDEV